MEIIRYTDEGAKEKLDNFLSREEVDSEISANVATILEKVRLFGDKAVSELTQNFDEAFIEPGQSKVRDKEFSDAEKAIDPSFRASFDAARNNIRKYYEMQKRKNLRLANKKEGFLLEMTFNPIQTIGVYIPGGTAPLVSTVLMTVVPAQCAGVKDIVVCTPPNVSAKIHPYILAACQFLGVKNVYKIGGAQAIAAMAYGTETVPKVDKIFGPGNIYVSIAKSQVFGQVSVDLIAGPSEIVILADDSADSDYLAADMISQAEHDRFSKSVLVTDSERLVQETKTKIYQQLHDLPRREIAEESIRDYCLIVLVEDIAHGVEIANFLAPEHLEILTKNPRKWVKGVRNAGTVLVGEYSPAVVGDFVAGPSHVLPTNRSARAFSGITLDDYMKKTNVIEFSAASLARYITAIRAFSSVEGLDGHYRSAQIRLDKNKKKSKRDMHEKARH